MPQLAARLLALLLLALVLHGCAPTITPSELPDDAELTLLHNRVKAGRAITSRLGLVVCADTHAAQAGAQVLSEGGNAVDAAVTVALVLAVTHPQAGNIGGGGFMLVRLVNGRADAFDYRETAPAAFKPDVYLGEDGRVDRKRYENPYLQVGVPGTLKGLALAHATHGTKPWRLLVQPALRLARAGFRVSPLLARDIELHQAKLRIQPSTHAVFFHQDGAPLQPGDLLRQPELAGVLHAVAEEGAEVFYRGWVGESLVRKVQAGGGLMVQKDLLTYEVKLRKPVRAPLVGGTLIGMPPPSSGGIAVAQILGILEPRLTLRKLEPTGAQVAHALAEAGRRAFRDRARYLGDPDYVDVPIAELLSQSHLDQLGADITPERATPSEELWPERVPEPLPEAKTETTHFSIIDREGMAVANTYTLEQSFGGGVVAPGLGFLLNNELGDFNPRPGETNRAGRIGTLANIPEGGKRPLSSMSPTFFERDGKLEIITGSPGGRTIISTVAQVLMNRLFFELGPERSVWGPRLHHGWFPDQIRVERFRWPGPTLAGLEEKGHKLVGSESQGAANSIFLDRERGVVWVGVGDFRRDGVAAAPIWIRKRDE